MAETSKTRLSKLRKYLVIPRSIYLAAIKRQEDRAWAKWTDPAKDVELQNAFKKVRDCIAEKEGIPPEEISKLPAVRNPDPALFDKMEDIVRDEKIITVYLADNPDEPKKPMARGTTHEELLEFWKDSADGRQYFQYRDRQIYEAVKQAKAKVFGDS